MNSIFASKALLDAEYKRLFLHKLSHPEELKESIKARYDKKDISDETLRLLFSNNHKAIYDFIGSHNESRIRNFFGVPQFPDDRDTQIRVADRLILDAIHFDIIATLMIRFAAEYSQDQLAIDKEWQAEIDNIHHLESISSFLIIQNAIKLNKQRVFHDLVFPQQQNTIILFFLKGNSMVPNGAVFTNWLPKEESNQSRTTLLYISAALVAAGCMMIPIIFGAYNSLILVGAASIFSLSMVLIPTVIFAMLLIAGVSGIIHWTASPNNPISVTPNPVNESQLSINIKIAPENSDKITTEIPPFHNTQWSLTVNSSSSCSTSDATEEDSIELSM